jgi:membrane protein YqaA with SNARE-associated domain
VHNHTLQLGSFSLLLTALPVIAPALSYRSGVIDAPIARMVLILIIDYYSYRLRR